MNEFLEVIKYIVPMLVLGAIFYFLIEKFFAEQNLRSQLELKKADRDLFIPQKYLAYERLALFIERIRPTSLVRRIAITEGADLYEHALVNAIQEEFDHNLSQQIYMDPETWRIIFSAKNAMQNYIKNTRANLENKNDVAAFRDALIQNSLDAGTPLDGAMLRLQKDIQVS